MKLKNPRREGLKKISKHIKLEKEGSSNEILATLLGEVRKRIFNLECSITANISDTLRKRNCTGRISGGGVEGGKTCTHFVCYALSPLKECPAHSYAKTLQRTEKQP